MEDRDDQGASSLDARERALRERIAAAERRIARMEGKGPGWTDRVPWLKGRTVQSQRELPTLTLRAATTTLCDVLHADLGLVGQVHTADHGVEWRSVEPRRLLIARLELEGERSLLTLELRRGNLGLRRGILAAFNLMVSACMGVITTALVLAGYVVVNVAPWHLAIAVALAAAVVVLGVVMLVRWSRAPVQGRLDRAADRLADELRATTLPRTRVREEINDDNQTARDADGEARA